MRNLVLRLLILGITAICMLFYKESMPPNFIAVFLMFIGLILNYKISENPIDIISNYLFWVAFPVLIYTLRNWPLIYLTDSFLFLLYIKTFVLACSYIKHKKISVTSSFISKLWIFSVFASLSEIILNRVC